VGLRGHVRIPDVDAGKQGGTDPTSEQSWDARTPMSKVDEVAVPQLTKPEGAGRLAKIKKGLESLPSAMKTSTVP
jgi:hypothetical protein